MKNPSPQSTLGGQSTVALSLLALGVVYGDIGTSPLYAVKETFNPEHGIPLTPENILGGISAIFWALMIVVSLKYVTLVLRADNRAEGGIMALLALANASIGERPRLRAMLLIVGVFGAALFFGDAVLTPAISVLSAVEGLEVGTSAFKPYVVPLSTCILIGLFFIEKHGTSVIGLLFGPVCILWFTCIAAAGLWNVVQAPEILAALNPIHAVKFITGHGTASFLVLGSVLLALTGAEALYADMGHFGKKAIRLAWFSLVAPALVLNYMGQGALLIKNPAALENPFYLAFPPWALYPMIALATTATVIAAQATISGAYSMTQQAIQLGYLPRMLIRHTSSREIGQIYVPFINWLLLGAVIAATVGFGSSTRLASAYGVAVMGTMLVTTFLTFFVVRNRWSYPLWLCILATAAFGIVDLTFFAAAANKIFDGGWFPLLLGSIIFGVMTIWRNGRISLLERLNSRSINLVEFLDVLFKSPPYRIPGTAVFLNSTAESTPQALLHSLKHYRVLHETNIFLTVEFKDIPWISFNDRVRCERLGHDCWRVYVRYGFMNRPDIVSALEICGTSGLQVDPEKVSYFLSKETLIANPNQSSWHVLQDIIFSAMARNADSVTNYFNIPINRVVELGTRVEL
jgi:KUP system potassium uptake protein